MNEPALLFLTELEVALMAQARRGRPLGYLDLTAVMKMPGPHRIHRLTQALEVLARRDLDAGRPLLAALAVGRSGIPGRGFFQLLAERGAYQGADDGAEARRWHAQALAEAIAYWGSVVAAKECDRDKVG